MTKKVKGAKEYAGKKALALYLVKKLLHSLYTKWGYQQIMPSSFELYDNLYNLVSEEFRKRLISLTSPYGELVCLRGEMTIATLKLLKRLYEPHDRPQRFFYIEKLYKTTSDYQQKLEFYQAGIELIGQESIEADIEVLYLLHSSLTTSGVKDYLVLINDSEIINGITNNTSNITETQKERIKQALLSQSMPELKKAVSYLDIPKEEKLFLRKLFYLRGGKEVLQEAEMLLKNRQSQKALSRLKKLWNAMCKLNYSDNTEIDLSLIRELGFYSGPIFEAMSYDAGTSLGGGGRYDKLTRQLGLIDSATGFGLDIETIAETSTLTPHEKAIKVTILNKSADFTKTIDIINKNSNKDIVFENLSEDTEIKEAIKLSERKQAKVLLIIEKTIKIIDITTKQEIRGEIPWISL